MDHIAAVNAVMELRLVKADGCSAWHCHRRMMRRRTKCDGAIINHNRWVGRAISQMRGAVAAVQYSSQVAEAQHTKGKWCSQHGTEDMA